MPYDRPYRAIIKADGTAIIPINTFGQQDIWIVRQVSVFTTPDTGVLSGSRCVMKKNGVYITDIIPSGDAAVEPPAISLDPSLSDEITIELSGMGVGAIVSAFVIYTIEGIE